MKRKNRFSGSTWARDRIKQEAPLPRRGQRVRCALLVYYMTFLGENLLMAN